MAEVKVQAIADSYWVTPGRLLVGEYPGSRWEGEAAEKLRWLLGLGITLFVDLTQESEGLKPYEPVLRQEASRMGVAARRLPRPMRDLSVLSVPEMRETLDAIDAALVAGEVVYVHCWGGIGRAGTVVGCYLARHGLTGQPALDRIKQLRAGTPDAWQPSPETSEQQEMVRQWKAGE
jgi:hypothetical protein